ncbi:MAG: DUF3313 domain-containing protein [Candidatus Lindowbacteria bacterium]|nr:DUF3313 domain-containing protein [Candidatus Lindowbacteria bacterium]
MNKISLSTPLSIVLCLTVTILSACATKQQAISKPVYTSGSSTSNTATNPQYEEVSGDHSRWIGDELKAGNYKQLIIDPVTMSPLPEDLNADQQARLNDLFATFNQILLTELSSKISVVNTPGIGVARLLPTFTSIASSTQGMKAYEVIPLAALIGGIKAATGTRGKEVELWLEAKVVDSQTNELLARIVRKGTADQANRKQATVEDVREMLQEWAKGSADSAAKLFN